jgi:MPBQ/MSBQ methyltransferase
MPNGWLWALCVVAALGVAALVARSRLQVPSRRYAGPASVADVYDQWTRARVLECSWGEHLHAGHYGDPVVRKAFVRAKIDMIDEVIRWGLATPCGTVLDRLEPFAESPAAAPARILDVGCGIGGSTRYLAARWRKTAQVVGVTISKAQAERAAALTRAQGLDNAVFVEGDAGDLAFRDASFDVIWAMESEQHMPDKRHFIAEMFRVLKPGGVLVVAAWNIRDTRRAALSASETRHLRLLLDEWCHAQFISIHEYVTLFETCGLVEVASDDWSAPTLPSWRGAVFEGLRSPRGMLRATLSEQWRLTRDAYTMLRLGAAFRTGLCQYGLIRGRKAASPCSRPSARANAPAGASSLVPR